MRTVTCLSALIVTALLTGCTSHPHAEDRVATADTVLADPALEPLRWLVGDWISIREDGSVLEECWQPPIGPCMVGSFRIVRNGEIGFYEILTIEVEDGEPLLRLKHFNAQLVGWDGEDQGAADGWPVVEQGPAMVAFELAKENERERLTSTRTGDALAIDLLIDQGGGPRTVPFRFTRR